MFTDPTPRAGPRPAIMARPRPRVAQLDAATLGLFARCRSMIDDECLNLRLGDYFHQRREPEPSAVEAEAEEPDDEDASRD